VKTHQVFRHNRVVDGIMRMDEPASLWRPLAAFFGASRTFASSTLHHASRSSRLHHASRSSRLHHLPPDPEFDWLRMTTRLPESREEILLVESLLSSRKIDKLTKAELEETMFELMIDGKTPKEAKAEAMELRSEAVELRSRLAEALEAKQEAVELRSQLADALEAKQVAMDVQTAMQKALEQESREREKLSLALAEMQRQLAEFKNSK